MRVFTEGRVLEYEFPFPFVRVASDVPRALLTQHFSVVPNAS